MSDGKVCTRCREYRERAEFSPAKTKDGMRSHCKYCLRKAKAAYRAAHPEKIKAANAQPRDAEAVRRHTAKWRAANREAVREANRRYRAKKLRAHISAVDVEAVWLRDKSTCHLCGKPVSRDVPWPQWMSPSIDHIIPLARGGSHSMDNIALAHLGCNQSKGARVA